MQGRRKGLRLSALRNRLSAYCRKRMSIVGESGSGKTTVIRAIMGCLPGAGRVSRGSIIFDGKDVLQNTPDEWRKMYGSEMSMIFQDSGNMINPIRRIGQQFIDYVQAHQPDKSKDQAYKMCCDMLTNVRLPNPENIMNSYPFELSGGMRGYDFQPENPPGR